MRKCLLLWGALAGLASTSVAARPAPKTGTPPSVQSLLSCRALTDSAQRLACFDRAAGAVAQAIGSREIVMIDRAKANQAKRSLFGFSVPDFGGLFGGGGDDEIKEIQGTVTSFGHNADGGWVIRLADGSTWSQTDDAQLGLPPRKGDKVVVRRGTFGNFFLRLGSQPGFKVKRVG
jgi:hypothetical protein